MTEYEPHSDAAENRYRCWNTILTKEGDKALRSIDADLIMTAAILGFSDRLLADNCPVEFASEDPLESSKGKQLLLAVKKINWVLNRPAKARATDPTESEEMQWKHGSVITGARGQAGDAFHKRHKTPASFKKGSPAREFFEILKDTRTKEDPQPREGDIWGYQGRGAYTGYVVDSKGGTMTSTTRFNAPSNQTRWVPEDHCKDNKTWGLIAGLATLPPEKDHTMSVTSPDGKSEQVDLGYGHGGMKQHDTTAPSRLSQETWQELTKGERGLRMCGTGSGTGPSVVPEKLAGKSRLVGYTHGMIQAIYICKARELGLKTEISALTAELRTELEAFKELLEFTKIKTMLSLNRLVNLNHTKQLEEVKTLKRVSTLQALRRLSPQERLSRKNQLRTLELKVPYEGVPYEIAVGQHTRKLASCFTCSLFMYGAGYPPSALHLGKGESWMPLYPSEGSSNVMDTAITNTNKQWHGQCRKDLARGLEILDSKRVCLDPQHGMRLGALNTYLDKYSSGEQAANLILDAVTVHDSETARINRTILDPEEIV